MKENEDCKINVDFIKSVLKQKKETCKEFMESIYSPGSNTAISKISEGMRFCTACKIADHLGVPLDSLRSDRNAPSCNNIQGSNNSNNNNYTYINDHAAEINALRLEVKSLNAIIKEKETKEALYERLLSQLSASKDETVSLYERESNKIQ